MTGMISNKEEEELLSNAVQMHQQVEVELELQSSAIRFAVQKGLERGKRKSKMALFSKSTFIGFAAAAAVAILLFVLPYIQSEPQTARPLQRIDWTGLEDFKDLSSFDVDDETVYSALRNGYIQKINKSVSSEGFTVTLNAVTADENKLIMLYTATADNAQEIHSINSAKLEDKATNSYLKDTMRVASHFRGPGVKSYSKFIGRSTFDLDRSKPFPEQLEADFKIALVDPGMMEDPNSEIAYEDVQYSPSLKISFTLASKFKEHPTQTVYPDKTFTLEGHEITLTQVEFSPLMTRVNLALQENERDQWQIRDKLFVTIRGIEIASETKKGVDQLLSYSGGGTDEGFSYLLSSNLLDKPRSMELLIKTGSEEEGLSEIKLKIPVVNQ